MRHECLKTWPVSLPHQNVSLKAAEGISKEKADLAAPSISHAPHAAKGAVRIKQR